GVGLAGGAAELRRLAFGDPRERLEAVLALLDTEPVLDGVRERLAGGDADADDGAGDRHGREGRDDPVGEPGARLAPALGASVAGVVGEVVELGLGCRGVGVNLHRGAGRAQPLEGALDALELAL